MIRAGIIRAILPAVALATAAVPALGQDSRLVERLYNPAEVVRINGQAKVQATIKFGEDESIENVAIGDSQSWQVTPNKRANLLFVKPLTDTAATNMTVVTNKRTYLFDLVASPRSRPLYVLSFIYPDEPKEDQRLARNETVSQTVSETEMTAASDPYAVVDPAQLNFNWKRQGADNLLPGRTFDDGDATYLTWAAGTAVPAILIKDAKGTEGPVNFTVRGETVVIHGVPREIILRSGKDSATLTNMGPERAPARRSGDAALAQATEKM
jgi:type IV secretion system protein VirB9